MGILFFSGPRKRQKLHPDDRAYARRVAKNKARTRLKERQVEAAAERRTIRARNRLRTEGLGIDDGYGERMLARDRRINQKRRAAKLHATPKWADQEKIAAVFLEAARRERETGMPHEVDHVVPLVSDIVCGLHCEQNLQVLTEFENISKGNRAWPDMP